VTKLEAESIDAVVLVGLVVRVVLVQLGLGRQDLLDLLVVAVVAVATILVGLPVDLLVVAVVVANLLVVLPVVVVVVVANRRQVHKVHLHLHHHLHHLLDWAMAKGLCLEVVECRLMDESILEWGMVVDCSAACRLRDWHVPWLHMLGCPLLVFDCCIVGSMSLC
jgi:hypothetical protein